MLKKVLVVDDDTAVLELIVELLSGEQGISVVGIDDPLVAKDIFRGSTIPIALLISDIDMPKITGIELANWVMGDGETGGVSPNTKVLLMSGNDHSEETDLPILEKPLNMDELVKIVRRELGLPENKEPATQPV